MHLKGKKFPGSCQQLFKEPIARTFQRLLFVIAGGKKTTITEVKRLRGVVAPRSDSEQR